MATASALSNDAQARQNLVWEQISLTVNGTDISVSIVRRDGPTEPILFLHGFGSTKEDYTDISLHSSLSEYPIIAYDAPGSGASTITDYSALSMPFLVAVAEAVLKTYGRNPGSVLSFTNIKGNLAPEDCFLSRQILDFPAEDPEMFVTEFIERTRRSAFFGNGVYAAAFRAKVRTEAIRPTFESMVEYSDNGDLLEIFKGLTCPRMFMFGVQHATLSYLPAIAKAGVELAEIPKSGHFVIKQAGGTKRILSAWAHVSREWQRFFEPDIFERLSLQVPGPDIRQLKYIVVNGRQKLVRKISLHVHLAWYSRQQENEFEDEFTKKSNTRVLSDAILTLFSVLSGWKQDASAQGLAFELSATSPSYYLHQEGRRYRPELQLRASKQRLLGALLDIRFNSPSVSIPSVPIITSFSMNQRSHRKLSASALAMLLACMPCLRDVNYQPVWVGLSFADHDSERKRECDARNLAISTLFRSVYMSPSLQDLSLWEAQYDDHPIYQRTVPECLVSVAVLASYRLRNFTISNVIDAAQFFKCHESMTQDSSGSLSYPYWPNLMYLCLTTERGMDNLGDLLERAAGAARQMPKLRIMEVWCPKVDTQGPMSFLLSL
ncbi:hypothetical protein CcaCcLH18_10740 [Colletotrichum camelliae]|nr:hypothetical protein CcaCcLH18_10740 [Colletotrichum camelliae]